MTMDLLTLNMLILVGLLLLGGFFSFLGAIGIRGLIEENRLAHSCGGAFHQCSKCTSTHQEKRK